MPKLIDSHCHLDFEVLASARTEILENMVQNNVAACVTISTRVHEFSTIRAIAEKNHNVFCSVGTHPHNAHEELDIQTLDLVKFSKYEKCVAIGEAGLDYHYDKSPREAQAEGFRRHIAASRETQLPLVIHARNADEDMAQILTEETQNGAFPFVLHCFSSGTALARKGLDLGGYLSFSGIATFKNAHEVQAAAKFAPQDRILVETDAPYLAPVPHRGKTNQPAFVLHTAQHVAQLREADFDQFANDTTDNFFRLFSKADRGVIA